jgi:hypothetical protein
MVSSRKRFLDAARDKIKSSKRVMFFLAACFLILGLVIGFSMDDFATMISNLVLSLIYLILAAWCEKNPFGATLTALILYATLILVGTVLEPSSLASGIILKIIVISALVKGIRSAQEAQKYLAELEKLKAVPA